VTEGPFSTRTASIPAACFFVPTCAGRSEINVGLPYNAGTEAFAIRRFGGHGSLESTATSVNVVSDVDQGTIYRDIRVRITALVRELPDQTLDYVAPATPEWRIRDLIAHLAGGTADIVAGNLADVASEDWTSAQVEARRNILIGDVLEEWARCSAIVEPMIAKFDPLMRAMLLTDAVTHEHDLRGALGVPGERESDAVAYAFRGVAGGIGRQRGDTGALRILHEAGETVVGAGEPTATVQTTRFEVVRASVGRRSYDQIAAWDWEGDARQETVVLARFAPPRTAPLNE